MRHDHDITCRPSELWDTLPCSLPSRAKALQASASRKSLSQWPPCPCLPCNLYFSITIVVGNTTNTSSIVRFLFDSHHPPLLHTPDPSACAGPRVTPDLRTRHPHPSLHHSTALLRHRPSSRCLFTLAHSAGSTVDIFEKIQSAPECASQKLEYWSTRISRTQSDRQLVIT